jgi:hypothetical protein
MGILALVVSAVFVALLLHGGAGNSTPEKAVSSVEESNSRMRPQKSLTAKTTETAPSVTQPQARSVSSKKRPRAKPSDVVLSTGPEVRTIASALPARQIQVTPHALATLRLRIEHRFAEAEVFMWIDDNLAYRHTVGGIVKKRMVVFKGVEGHQSDVVRVAPGEHRFRVRVHATDDSYDQTGTISSTLPDEGERQILIQCEKHKPVRLIIQ